VPDYQKSTLFKNGTPRVRQFCSGKVESCFEGSLSFQERHREHWTCSVSKLQEHNANFKDYCS